MTDEAALYNGLMMEELPLVYPGFDPSKPIPPADPCLLAMGLRQMADAMEVMYEAGFEIPTYYHQYSRVLNVKSHREFLLAQKLLPGFKPSLHGTDFHAEKTFAGSHKLVVYISRDAFWKEKIDTTPKP